MIFFFKSIFSFLVSFLILSIPVGNKPLFQVLFTHTEPVTSKILMNVQVHLDKGLNGTKKLITAKEDFSPLNEETLESTMIEREVELPDFEDEKTLQAITPKAERNIIDKVSTKVSGVKKTANKHFQSQRTEMGEYSPEEKDALNNIIHEAM